MKYTEQAVETLDDAGSVIANKNIEIEQLRQRVAALEERRCEVCGYAEHHREHTGCLREKVKELTAERDRLSELCDKWNFECDEMREDNERLANVVNAMKKAYESAEESVLALKETRNRLAEERDKATQYWQIAEGRCDALLEANRIACEDLVERHDRIAELKQQRDELLEATALAMPVMDAHAGDTRKALFYEAIASVEEK